MNQHTNSTSGARLAGSIVILTGAAGNIGSQVTRRLLGESARVVLTGRNRERLDAFVEQLAGEGFDRDAMLVAVGDSADPEACRRIVAATVARFGGVDVLVNNAGGAGPKHILERIPFTDAERRERGDDETMFDAAMNLLGGAWNMTRAVVPHLSVGGSIVNVSTIFSRTPYYGRIPYAVPKSGLNALSAGLARELGLSEKAIRVNTVFPGPIESERIDKVFAAMDDLQELDSGSTSRMFRELMIGRRQTEDGESGLRYPTPADVASTIVFLAAPESAAYAGQTFEVTNGMQVPVESRSKLVSWPDNRLVDLSNRVVLVLGGADIDEALTFAGRNIDHGASVVLGFRDLEMLGQARVRTGSWKAGHIQLQHLDPLRAESIERALQFVEDHFGRLDGVIVLPARPNRRHGHPLAGADDEEVASFVRNEIVAPVAFGSTLSRIIENWDALEVAPAITYVTNKDDRHGNLLNEIQRAAVEQLIRIWRYESLQRFKKGEIRWTAMPNQLVRYDNAEPDGLTFAADWSATLTNRVRKMDPINLWVPKSIERATGKTAMPMSIQRVLPGLHHGKTVVITGGSLGIGLQLGRFLALAGARVLLSARSEPKLAEARDAIVAELEGIGYGNPQNRVFILAGIDVGDEAALQRLYDHAIELFGDIDYLINNAGISGAEEMVVDMSVDDWNRTMEANLVSNYSLIAKAAPRMKARGSGKILNVSSYFGGEKYLAVAYPNRADYSVSKAGQRVLAEILSRHLGPEIQINVMAPGPVDGARLRGLGGAPGLFERRGRLILENKRLNQVHAALLRSVAEGMNRDGLHRLAANAIAEFRKWPAAPEPLKRLFAQVAKGPSDSNATHYLLNEGLAPKLMDRLVIGGQLSKETAAAFLEEFVAPPEPFFQPAAVQHAAEKIEAGIINRLHLHRMPTDEQVALSTVFSLADEIVSGETFHPSGGLKFERSVTEGEMMLKPGEDDLSALAGRHVVIIGDAMREELVAIAQGFIRCNVRAVTVLTGGEDAAGAVRHGVEVPEGIQLETRAVGDDLEGGLDAVLAEHGKFDVVVSTPFARLPLKPLAAEAGGRWDRVLSTEDFASLISDQLTHHFRVAKRAALVSRCEIVLVTPDTSRASTREEFALALFTKNALHAFTVTLGVESERLPTVPAINQVQLTRRARVEEPGNDQELAEEMERLVYAVLQCAVPAPSPAESRYLSRIFRGNAVTV